tara:strand:+ start:1885 stop:2493 length:609 start_codon:yes stop_codon:yes gene_type:complete
MNFTIDDIKKLNRVSRLNLINSITGYKPANLIGTQSKKGDLNLAIFSSLVHLGSKPPLFGLVTRPKSVPRHTYSNIIDTNYYTINHISKNMIERAHMTSAKFNKEDSEFKKCNIEEEYIDNFIAPFVKESEVKIGMKFIEEIHIKSNSTILIVGEVVKIIVKEEYLCKDGSINFEKMNTVCISGLDTYYETKKLAKYPYAKR